DLVDGDANRDDARREVRDVLARRGKSLAHDFEDMHAALACLFERLTHDIGGDPRDLDIHLQCGDSCGGTRHLEVHIAVMIFGAPDITKYRVLPGCLVHHESHRDTGDWCLERDAGIHHPQRTSTD